MNSSIQKELEELFSNRKPKKNSSVYKVLGRLFGRVIPRDEVIAADIAIGNNPGPLYNLEEGFRSETNSKKDLKKIGINLSQVLHEDIECKVGMAQKLPLNPTDADVLVYNDLFSHIEYSLPWMTTLNLICEEALRVSPKYIVFSDPRIFFRIYRELAKKPNDYDLIYSMLSSQYTDLSLQRYVDGQYQSRFGSPHVWMFLMNKDLDD